MAILEPPNNDNNNEEIIPGLSDLQSSNLTLEEQFLKQSYTRTIDRVQNIDELKKLTHQLVGYYFQSQKMMKSMIKDNLGIDKDVIKENNKKNTK